jgi:hypothetical protein
MNKVKSILLIFLVNLFLLFFIEIASYFILKNLSTKDASIIDKNTLINGAEKSKYFCDSMHTFEEMQKLMADHLLAKIDFKSKNELWFFGGSTTKSNDCDINLNYPDFIKRETGIKTEIIAASGETSDDQMNALLKKININNVPDIIFWGSWINDLNLVSKGFSVNKEIIYKNYPELDRTEEIKKNKRGYFLSSLSKTLFTYINTYKLLFHLLVPDKALLYEKTNEELQKSFRYLQAIIDNYELNINKLIKLKEKYNFEIVFIQPPYRDIVSSEYGAYYDGKFYKIKSEYIEKYLMLITKIRRNTISPGISFINFKEVFKAKIEEN